MKRIGLVLLAGVVVGTILLLTASRPRTTSVSAAPAFIYSVQYLCNKVTDNDTLIAIHNFPTTDTTIQWKVSQANALELLDSDPGPISVLQAQKLAANQSGFIDCGAIRDRFEGSSFFIPQGFVEIISPVEISVVATYTRNSANGIAMEVEQYKPFSGQLPRR